MTDNIVNEVVVLAFRDCFMSRFFQTRDRWVLDRKSGVSSGTMSMPRILTLASDKLSLNIEPPEEVEELRYNLTKEKPFEVAAGQSVILNKAEGNVLEIDLTIDPGNAKRFGLKVFCSEDGREQTPVVIDREKNNLQIDMRFQV